MKYDLHCHSTASDGELCAQQLLDEAQAQGIELFAVTDHDTLAGYLSIRHNDVSGVRLISGIEFSSRWNNHGIHVVGLGVNADDPALEKAVEIQREARALRAQEIADRLEKKGLTGSYEGALALCDHQPWRIGRLHFARYLLETGQVSSLQKAFDCWLGAGKVGDVRHAWPELAQVVEWINRSGGTAVLAHPAKYRFTRTRLKLLLGEFCAAGGGAIEVIGAGQTPDVTRHLAQLSIDYGLAASGGSDFHSTTTPWCKLGAIAAIPANCQPVWELLS